MSPEAASGNQGSQLVRLGFDEASNELEDGFGVLNPLLCFLGVVVGAIEQSVYPPSR